MASAAKKRKSNEWAVVDTKALINFVSKSGREWIWNISTTDHRKAKKRQMEFEKLQSELEGNFSAGEISAKFTTLRTQFFRNHKKVMESIPEPKQTGSGGDDNPDEPDGVPTYVPSWERYEQMKFLLSGPGDRRSVDNLQSSLVDGSMNESTLNEHGGIDEEDDDSESGFEASQMSRPSSAQASRASSTATPPSSGATGTSGSTPLNWSKKKLERETQMAKFRAYQSLATPLAPPPSASPASSPLVQKDDPAVFAEVIAHQLRSLPPKHAPFYKSAIGSLALMGEMSLENAAGYAALIANCGAKYLAKPPGSANISVFCPY